MKKKLLVVLIAASSMLLPNLASAIAIDVGDEYHSSTPSWGVLTDFTDGGLVDF